MYLYEIHNSGLGLMFDIDRFEFKYLQKFRLDACICILCYSKLFV